MDEEEKMDEPNLLDLFVNLTPHAIVIYAPARDITIPESGKIARMSVTEIVVGAIGDIPVIISRYGEIFGLPEISTESMDHIYIVSSLVMDAYHGMLRVMAPDTGPTAIRNSKGQIVAVTRFRVRK